MLIHIKESKWEVADIFRLYGKEYRDCHCLPPYQLKVMHAIEICRTEYLGGHREKCDNCGHEHYNYHSCRNRHCPKCQTLTKAKWLEDRKAELLHVSYFHNVFTLPHELNPIALANKKLIYGILFKSVAETLLHFGHNPEKGLNGTLGFIAILHTWDQKLLDHIHLHCVIPGGALSSDKSRWIPSKKDYLFNVEALSITFRGKFLYYFKKAFTEGEVILTKKTGHLEEGFRSFIKSLYKHKWVVYCKKPFAGPEAVLDYVGRYTHRIALSNNRILDGENDRVTFTYRDRKDDYKLKEETIEAHEFIRRFLIHTLPSGFMKIRHYGFLANRSKKDNLIRIRQLLGMNPELPERIEKKYQELMLELTGTDITKCPECKKGTMRIVERLKPLYEKAKSVKFDTS